MKKTGKQNIRWNTMKILAVGFLSVIFLGAVLLLSDSKPSDSDDKYLHFCTELISATFTE